MSVRIDLASTVEADLRIVFEPEISRAEPRMLPGKDKQRRKAASREGSSNRGEFYGFGPGADDQYNGIGQSSP
jgi:hypothetical protein